MVADPLGIHFGNHCSNVIQVHFQNHYLIRFGHESWGIVMEDWEGEGGGDGAGRGRGWSFDIQTDILSIAQVL
jgi:hypothetical protein